MALRLSQISLPSTSFTRTSNTINRIYSFSQLTIMSSTSTSNRHQNKRRTVTVSPPPLPKSSPFALSPDELASLISNDVTISTLEHLFSSSPSTSGPPPPSTSTPSSPRRRPPVRVAYQGVRGSYCQEAATLSFSSVASSLFPCGSTLESPFSALEQGDADRAVLPVENSLDGPIPRNLDLLIRHAGEVKIVGEIILPVNHCLLCLPGSDPSKIRRVVSHPQAISHCRERLESMNIETVDEVQNAADFARFVAEEGIQDTAVIGSEIAAREFGLEVIHRNFQDQPGNFNRFLQLGTGTYPSAVGGNRKTTVAFSLEKGPSNLFQAMFAFESRGVKVSRVDHRPNRKEPIRFMEKNGIGSIVGYFDYVFVLDVEGSEDDPAVRSAINRLDEITGFLRVLGSYTTASS